MQFVRRHPQSILLALAVLAAALAVVLPSGARTGPLGGTRGPIAPLPPPRSGGDVSDYRGLGTWIDIYDTSWSSPRKAVEAMAARGVRTLYLETSNYKRHHSFVFKDKVEKFLDAAETAGVRTVAWYLPGFRDLRVDFDRSLAAIELETASGNRFDSFALDIEAPEVRNASRRSARLLRLSEMLRQATGDAYPLGAIIPSPRGIQFHSSYWPDFPYVELMSYYDVILPMTYFTWRVHGPRGANRYTEQNVDIIREQTGDPTFPIHVIGGIANEATTPQTRAFVRAVLNRGVLGASYYTFPLTGNGQWRALRNVPGGPGS
jgi:hypothetical protein